MMKNTSHCVGRMFWLSVGIALSLIQAASLVAAPVDYEATIKPLLKQRCASCHGALKQEADLRLDAGALIPPEIRSEILKRVASNDESERMPPEGPRLTAEQIAAIADELSSGGHNVFVTRLSPEKAAYVARATHEAARFDGVDLPRNAIRIGVSVNIDHAAQGLGIRRQRKDQKQRC